VLVDVQERLLRQPKETDLHGEGNRNSLVGLEANLETRFALDTLAVLAERRDESELVENRRP